MRTTQYPIDVNTDYIKDMFASHSSELTAIYGHLNSLFTLQASTTPPATPVTNEVFVDMTDRAEPVLKSYVSGAWQDVRGEAYTAAGPLEHMFSSYLKNTNFQDRTYTYSPGSEPPFINWYISPSTQNPMTVYIGPPGEGKLYKWKQYTIPCRIYNNLIYWQYVWISASSGPVGFVCTAQLNTTERPAGGPWRYLGRVKLVRVLTAGRYVYSLNQAEMVENKDHKPSTPY